METDANTNRAESFKEKAELALNGADQSASIGSYGLMEAQLEEARINSRMANEFGIPVPKIEDRIRNTQRKGYTTAIMIAKNNATRFAENGDKELMEQELSIVRHCLTQIGLGNTIEEEEKPIRNFIKIADIYRLLDILGSAINKENYPEKQREFEQLKNEARQLGIKPDNDANFKRAELFLRFYALKRYLNTPA